MAQLGLRCSGRLWLLELGSFEGLLAEHCAEPTVAAALGRREPSVREQHYFSGGNHKRSVETIVEMNIFYRILGALGNCFW